MYRKTTLDNGLRLVTAELPYSRSISIGFFIGAGSRYESETQAGVSHFIEHMCFRGTSRRPTSHEIATAIEGVGGILNAGTNKELTVFWCKVAQPHFPTALDVLVDMLLNSRFNPEDTEKERQIILEEIDMYYDSPSHRVALLIDELLWSGHPLGRDVAGSKESVMGITREILLDYLNAQYQPANTVVAIAGDIRNDHMESRINDCLSRWQDTKPKLCYSPYQRKESTRLKLERRPELEQVHLCMGMPGIPLLHPERFTIDLLSVILGEGMSSRLFTEVRDKKGLAYSVGSFVDHFLDTGALTIAAGVEPKNFEVAVRAILEELHRLREPVPESELIKAKEYSKGSLLLRMEDSRNVAGWIGGQELLTGEVLSPDQVMASIDAVTAEDVKRLACDVLQDNKLYLAAVGPVPEDTSLEKLLRE